MTTTTNVQHSRAPWELSYNENARQWYIDAGTCQFAIKCTSDATSEMPANVRLLATAPALLAFCEALRDRYNTDDRLGGLGDWLEDVIARARATEETPR